MTTQASRSSDDIPIGECRRLINEFQRDLPLSPRPFRDIAEKLNWSESAVITALTGLIENSVVSRVGPVIRPNTIGVSALAAMAVPRRRLVAVADLVTRRSEVNHNYEREHRFNLWFVVTAASDFHLEDTVRRIEAESGIAVMVLPMLDDYYIDLGFDLDGGEKPWHRPVEEVDADTDDMDRRLLRAIQNGLPLVSKPYDSLGITVGLPEEEVCVRLGRLLDTGVIKRLGVIVRHHECGFRHNAMVVWDVPEHAVHDVGGRLASEDSVRLCYRRPRRPPDWPYNLFCMVHGRDRQSVLDEVDRIVSRARLDSYSKDILFSARRFKQRGARYDVGVASTVVESVGA